MILGVEVREDAVLAVAADDAGAITRRGKHDGATGSSAVDAVRAALGGGQATAIGVAVRDRREDSVPEVAKAIVAAAGGSLSPRILTRGCAVALGEQWRGAAKGGNQVIALIAKQMCRTEPAKAFSRCSAGNSILVQLGPGAHN